MRAAIFDLDGVLVRGFTRLDLGRFLGKEGRVSSGWWDKAIRDVAAVRRGEIPYARFVEESVADFAREMEGQSQAEVQRLLREEWAQVKVKPFWYAHDLVDLFNRRGFVTISISGSFQELLEVLAADLGLARVCGTTLALGRAGRYIGEVERNMALGVSKAKVMQDLAREFDLARSFAFGDTEQDLPVLAAVGHPVAVNPKGKLGAVAASRLWPSLTYRHPIVRRLEQMLEGAQ
ncbi:MAG: HAD family phosphatase [Chloroflexi bacterium]|nr:HAD family phosphatase [Chloroflexota bacterium]